MSQQQPKPPPPPSTPQKSSVSTSVVKKELSNSDLGIPDLPTLEFTSIFKSVKKGVKTGVKTAVKAGQDTRIRFSLEPYPGDPSYNQWKDAMKMVARLPEGVPTEFRKKLWLTLAEKYLTNKGVDWKKAERTCFNEWSNPDDDELGLQIVRDLHRTGCSLFCGEDAHANQLMLKRVLLAYARWNKSIGYCQGFNMLAAIILEVMEKAESDALKVMIFMIEGILPENYFSSNLRGLSVDMAVFLDLMKLRLPGLSKHLDDLQNDANDGCSPANYEPPLTNVFTMQWFLTLFSTCLPKDTVLRVWDLILLEGNEVLLRTALAIWKGLTHRVLTVKTADEFYCAMGQLSQEMLQFSVVDSNMLIKTLVEIAPFPFVEVTELREKYTFNITPWSLGIGVAKKGLRILYSDEEDEDEEDGLAVAATAFGVTNLFKPSPKTSPSRPQPKGQRIMGPSQQNVDKERLTVDISALRQQYKKLRQRQEQAHIILASAWNKNGILGENNKDPKKSVTSASTAMNHLLLGKKPLVAKKPRRPPPPGAIPSPKVKRTQQNNGTHMPTDSSKKANNSATHYACPQPDIVPPSSLKKKKKHRKRNSSSGGSPNSKTIGNIECLDSKSNSSTTEIGDTGTGNDTDGASDVEELPKDEPITISTSTSKLKTSQSSIDFGHHEPSEPLQRSNSVKSTHSQPDLLHLTEATDSNHFYEELLEEFDQHSSLENHTGNGNHVTGSGATGNGSGEENNSGNLDMIEENMSTKSNDRALQIIQENSSILETLLSKKSSPCSPGDPPLSSNTACSTKDGTLCHNISTDSNGCYLVPAAPPGGPLSKRKISHTSSNGSSSSNPSVKSHSTVTLQSNPATKPITFNPFPNSARANRKPKEVGRKLGLYK